MTYAIEIADQPKYQLINIRCTSKNSPYADLLRKMGNNPDIYLSADGKIQIVSTQFKGKSFITDLNIEDFLP